MMPVISFASSKGGAGKTTSAIVLATTLARRFRVCVIDADPAGRLMSWAEKPTPLPESLTVRKSQGERNIHDEIDQGLADHDFVVVDLEGTASRPNSFVMGESDLVIIPMGDEQPDAEGAIETLAQVHLQARAVRREIPVRILFARTKAAVKSRLEKSLNAQVRDKIGAFSTELHSRTAYSALHNYGGTLKDLFGSETTGIEKAIGNAELFAQEVETVLGWVSQIRVEQAKPKQTKFKAEINHGA
jgi:chromosome partitioning protein